MKLKRRSYHLGYYYILIYIISHLWIGIESNPNSAYSIKVSEHVTVQRGLCVHIPCSFTVPKNVFSKNARGIWYKQKKIPVASNRNTESRKNDRFLLTGDIQSGNCSLYIEDPLPEDEGSYYFRVEEKKKGFNYHDIKINVTELTDKPEIVPKRSLIDGEEVEIECTFTDTCERKNPEMKWEGLFQNESVTDTHATDHINGLNIHRSIITFIARKEQNKSPFACIVQLTERSAAVNHIILNVEYPPSVDITIDGSSVDEKSPINVLEGQTKSLECNVDSNPMAEITWFHEDRQLPVINQALTYTLKNISLNHTGRYSCKARNQHGTTEQTINISVDYLKDKPQIIVNGKLMAGEEANLTCIPPGNCNGTSPQVQWMKSDQSGTWKNSSFVTFIPSKRDHQTTVTCKVTFQTGKTVASKSKKLNVLYPPSLTVTTAENKIVNTSVNVSGQQPVTLICRADSNPEADVTWYKENNIVNRGKSSVALQINITSHTVYVCVGLNDLGMNLKHVEVFLPASWYMDNQIIIGIVTGNIFILLLFGLGVFCFIKRHVENKHRTESNDFELHDAKGTESVYQDLNRPSDSTYHTIQSAKQLIHHK